MGRSDLLKQLEHHCQNLTQADDSKTHTAPMMVHKVERNTKPTIISVAILLPLSWRMLEAMLDCEDISKITSIPIGIRHREE